MYVDRQCQKLPLCFTLQSFGAEGDVCGHGAQSGYQYIIYIIQVGMERKCWRGQRNTVLLKIAISLGQDLWTHLVSLDTPLDDPMTFPANPGL